MKSRNKETNWTLRDRAIYTLSGLHTHAVSNDGLFKLIVGHTPEEFFKRLDRAETHIMEDEMLIVMLDKLESFKYVRTETGFSLQIGFPMNVRTLKRYPFSLVTRARVNSLKEFQTLIDKGKALCSS